MSKRWSELSRSTRIGAVVGLVVVLPLAPFLIYAGIAVMNATTDWLQPTTDRATARLSGLAAFILYLFVVFGLPPILGGFIGAFIGSAR